MRVIVPFVGGIDQRVTDALYQVTGNFAEFISVADSDSTYWQLLSEQWMAREPFIVIEHDIVVTDEAWEELIHCSLDWCVQPYPYMETVHYGLGFARFSAELISRNHDVMDEVGRTDYPGHGPKHWCSLDQALTNALQRRGETKHEHTEFAGHLNVWPSHGCIEPR